MTAQIWRRTVLTACVAAGLMGAVASAAQATSIKEFPVTIHTGSNPFAVTDGPDGNVWFVDDGTTKAIGKITPSGTITEYTSGLTHGTPNDITLGPDGNLWFTETGAAHERDREDHAERHDHRVPDGARRRRATGSSSGRITTSGSWTRRSTQIGRVIPSTGTITEFGTGSGMMLGAQLNALDVGPDGNLWFTDQGGAPPRIGKLTISAPDASPTKITEFPDPTLKLPTDITGGSDGNVWFTDNNANVVGRITPSGTYTFYGMGNGLQTNGIPDGITLGPDGNIWFTDALGVQSAAWSAR